MALKKEKLRGAKPIIDLKDAWVDTSLGEGFEFLWGRPTNHETPSFNGTLVHTSYIVEMRGDVVETKRSVYNILNWDESKLPVQTELF